MTDSGTRRLPAALRRTQLLEVALQVFGSASFHSASMEEIAEQAGVTKPVLYQHFPSKSGLFRELIELVGAQLLEALVTAAAAESAPQARVRAGFGAYFRFVSDRPDAFRILFGGGARQDEDFAVAVQEVERRIAEAIGALIDARIDAEHRSMLGYAVVGLAESTSRQWVLDGTAPLDPSHATVLAGRVTDLVWAGLRGLPGAEGSP